MIEGKIANLFPRKVLNGEVICGKCSKMFEAPIPASISLKDEKYKTVENVSGYVGINVFTYYLTPRFIYESKSGRSICYCSEYCARKHNHRFTKKENK